jgi:hypothetical protein
MPLGVVLSLYLSIFFCPCYQNPFLKSIRPFASMILSCSTVTTKVVDINFLPLMSLGMLRRFEGGAKANEMYGSLSCCDTSRMMDISYLRFITKMSLGQCNALSSPAIVSGFAIFLR